MSNIIRHPSAFISFDNVSLIRQQSLLAEKSGKLTPQLLELIYREQWFKMMVPALYGGQGLDLPAVVHLEEAISWADGSLGWVVTLCSGAGWFGAFIDSLAASEIFKHEQLCVAGSGASSGTAEVTGKGYLINGTWKYASGVHHATHITVNCVITKNQEPLLTATGASLILPFILDHKDVRLLQGCKYIGMIATGSDAYTIDNVFVPQDRCFRIGPAAAFVQDALYSYPFLQLAEATLAANLSGMAVHFVDLCKPVFEEKALLFAEQSAKKRQMMFDALIENQTRLNTFRTNFYTALTASWNDPQNNHLLQQVSIQSRQLAHTSRKAVDNLYPYCGLMAAATDTEINRVWRDLHTATQHALLTFQSV